ncbi:hypothetical protein C2S53_002200 [Perilla frutescens var. hirtella]|uniref:Uncharacterized protein n=1 Tax=Perilla frutescens var. hirtella TaxID=608512 RepID=A0AAD4JLE3_PERFH|nr:hypothetical protein C2S53_002200 [Perilla frutescens var. hirtella]
MEVENWSADDEQLLLALLNAKARTTDVSKSVNTAALFHDMAKIMSEHCSVAITGVDVARKIQALVQEYNSFAWFVAIPGIFFLAERNMLFSSAEYMRCFGENESEEHKKFRLEGLPNFLHLREILVVKGLECVDLEWIIMNLSGADKRWMRAPVDRA